MDNTDYAFECESRRSYGDHRQCIGISEVLEGLDTAFSETSRYCGAEDAGSVGEGGGGDVENLVPETPLISQAVKGHM